MKASSSGLSLPAARRTLARGWRYRWRAALLCHRADPGRLPPPGRTSENGHPVKSSAPPQPECSSVTQVRVGLADLLRTGDVQRVVDQRLHAFEEAHCVRQAGVTLERRFILPA
jgi:hypothetical protein